MRKGHGEIRAAACSGFSFAEFTKQDARLDFLDITASMLGPDGTPRPELFVKDGLHLSPAGYKSWALQLESLLQRQD